MDFELTLQQPGDYTIALTSVVGGRPVHSRRCSFRCVCRDAEGAGAPGLASRTERLVA